MKVLLTGATSFTGAHIARALTDAGGEVAATLTKRLVLYSDPLIQKRRAHSKVVEWVEEAPFGSKRLNDFLRENKVDVFINHGAGIRGYRDPSFDYVASVKDTLEGARGTIEALADSGASRFVHSGSIFEPDEGVEPGKTLSDAVSIYGVSKNMVWEPLRFLARRSGLAVSKIVIPNPVGSFENEDRMIPLFVKTWKAGGVPSLRTPRLVRDNIPAPWLARCYVEEAGRVARPGEAPVSIRRPSGYVLSNEDFLKLVVENFRRHAGRNLPFEINPQKTDEPPARVNAEPAPELKNEAQEKKFWEEWAASLGGW